MNDFHTVFEDFHDVCAFVADKKGEDFNFVYQCNHFAEVFGKPKTLSEWVYPNDLRHVAVELDAFILIRLKEQNNEYLPYFMKYLYSDNTLSGFAFPQPEKMLGFENLQL